MYLICVIGILTCVYMYKMLICLAIEVYDTKITIFKLSSVRICILQLGKTFDILNRFYEDNMHLEQFLQRY